MEYKGFTIYGNDGNYYIITNNGVEFFSFLETAQEFIDMVTSTTPYIVYGGTA